MATNPTYADVTVSQGTTLEDIAGRYLGDPNRWPELAALNRLRFPYLSDDARERYGPALGRSQLRLVVRKTVDGDPITGILAGETLVPLTSDLTVRTGQLALFTRVTADAGPSWNAVPVEGVVHRYSAFGDNSAADPAVAELATALGGDTPPPPYLVLETGVSFPWPAGTEITIHEGIAEQRWRVLGPGDTLRVPIAGPGATLAFDADDRLMGTDLALDVKGRLAYDENGDVLTTSGVPNLRQALTLRLLTELGQLPLHPDYGDALVGQIGHVYPETLMLANAEARQAILGDPRVTGIERSSATHDGQILTVDVTVTVRGNASFVSVRAPLPITG